MPDDTPKIEADTPALSASGLARREEIFAAMTRSAHARKRRRIAVGAVSVSVSLVVLAWGAWAFFVPTSPLPSAPPIPDLVERAAPLPAPLPEPPAPRASPPVRVVAQFVPPSPGIAARLAAPLPARITAKSLSDSELQRILAEDGAGFARIRGKVFVLGLHPEVAEQAPETH